MSDLKIVELNKYKREFDQRLHALQSSSGGGTFDGMETRLATVETHIEHLRGDVTDLKTDVRGLRSDMWSQFRWTIALLGGLIIGLGGIMAHGFHWF
ncbi:MAG: hypothetical protein WDN46_17420 [Methylocella sp.]